MPKLDVFFQTELQKGTQKQKVKDTARALRDYLDTKTDARTIASELFANSEQYKKLDANNALLDGAHLYLNCMLNYYETFSPSQEEARQLHKIPHALRALEHSTQENALKNIDSLITSMTTWVKYQPKKNNEAALKNCIAIYALTQVVAAYIADNPIKTAPIHFIIKKGEFLKKMNHVRVETAAEIDALHQKIAANTLKYNDSGTSTQKTRIQEEQGSIKRRLNAFKEKLDKPVRDSPTTRQS